MPRPKKWTDDKLQELERLTQKLTFGEIAKELGMKTSAVQMACNRHGISGKQLNKRKRRHERLAREYRAQPDPFRRPL